MSRIQRIAAHPAYQQLSAERLRLGLWLSAATAGIYFAFIRRWERRFRAALS